jgi:hypothetical protein
MFSCNHLNHPFLNDPGTSQSERLPAALMEDSTPIDGRQISDFLNYFAGLSHQINFYDQNLNLSDWGPFFSGNLPFILSSISANDGNAITARYAGYKKQFIKRPSSEGLQLLFLYTWYAAIDPIQQWTVALQNSGLDLEPQLQTLIKNRLPGPVKSFISCMNTAAKCFCVKPMNVSGLLVNSAWGLTEDDLTVYDETFSCTIKSTRSQLLAMQVSLSGLLTYFTEVITLAASGAADQVNDNLYGVLLSSGLANTPPHLALLYAFLDQYLNVVNDLNNLTQAHLNFFFQEVLQLSPGSVKPDHVYIIFTLQKQVPSYALPAGLLLKDGKDSKNADVLFSLDAPVVITQTQATNFSTLFVNPGVIDGQPFVEGVYMAPDATKADGLTQAFPVPATASWPTLGARKSEYTPPQALAPIAYPLARIGFILTSKVLLMNEGVRKVHIQLACQWSGICGQDVITDGFAQAVSKAVGTRYLIITQEMLDQAAKLGVGTTTVQHLKDHYLRDHCHHALCEGEPVVYIDQKIISIPDCDWEEGEGGDLRETEFPETEFLDTEREDSWCAERGYRRKEEERHRWQQEKERRACRRAAERERRCAEQYRKWLEGEMKGLITQPFEEPIWLGLLQPQRLFTLVFSGATAALSPESVDMKMEIIDLASNYFLLHFYAVIGQDQPAVTFSSPAAMGENFDTTDPLAKIQLNQALSMGIEKFLEANAAAAGAGGSSAEGAAGGAGTGSGAAEGKASSGAAGGSAGATTCCLKWPKDTCGQRVSYYTFFRNVRILKLLPGSDVGSGKKWYVEKDERDWRTKIHVKVCGVKNLVVQNDDNILSAKKPFTPFGVKPIVPDFDIRRFTLAEIEPDGPVVPRLIVPGLNLVGPNFYVGSAEVFLKKWDRVNINLNWKGNPVDMFDYYGAYMLYSNGMTRADFPDQQLNMAALHNISWKQEARENKYAKLNSVTKDYNRCFFSKEDRIGCCDSRADYKYSFDLRPGDFDLEGQLTFDPIFAPLTSYVSGVTMNGFVRMTLENQDFLHKLYPTVMAGQIIALTKAAAGDAGKVPLPNEPWTPTILSISIDYEATAVMEDMELIQLYPYTGTFQSVDIAGEPALFATFCNEGNLFIGLSALNPGDGLTILFQLAEASADTEAGAATVNWQYLANNVWQALRPDFEIVEDGTSGLSNTGIIQFQFPNDISSNNTLMPAGLFWITATTPVNTAAISQTIAIITQAAPATFANNTTLNDQTRPATPLPAGSITKLLTPDPSVTGVSQPYDSFGGQAPEINGSAYTVRVSEQLRHKGRPIQKWDYERLVLQQFPKLLVAKCINHSYFLSSQEYKWDFPMSPGSIILAVLPDPSQLVVANSAQPSVPVSLLKEIEDWFAAIQSPFVTLSAANPRYEPVDICLSVTLKPNLDSTFYTNQLRLDIGGFLAPWIDGDTATFQFAQRLYRSDLVEFVENRAYIANLLQLTMCHEGEPMPATPPDFISPRTPRSILAAGTIVVAVPPVSEKVLTTTKTKLLHGRKH